MGNHDIEQRNKPDYVEHYGNVSPNESAKFWATVLNSLRNCGVEDIFIACTDNLTGFSTAIERETLPLT